jgi:hypothetical protein
MQEVIDLLPEVLGMKRLRPLEHDIPHLAVLNNIQ